jgi:hypothetical protein
MEIVGMLKTMINLTNQIVFWKSPNWLLLGNYTDLFLYTYIAY